MTLTASRAPSFVGNPPSYIRIVPDTLANLPAVDFDHIAVPEGSLGGSGVSHVPQTGGMVTPAHAANMAVINIPWYGSTFAGIHNGYDGDESQLPARYCFRGIHFKTLSPPISQVAANTSKGAVWLTSLSGQSRWPGSLGQMPNEPDHILFNQIYLDGDPGNYGSGCQQIARVRARYFGFFNSWVEGTWAGGDGSAQQQQFEITGDGIGPYQIENCRIPAPGNNWIMTGGGSANSWPGEPCIIMRHNDLCVPWAYRQSEISIADAFVSPGYTQQVGGGGYTLNKISGWGTNPGQYQVGNFRGPQPGGYVVDPSTGTARRIASVPWGVFTGYTGPITLSTPWPAADGTTFLSYIQMPSPQVLYNSGVTGVLAHTTAGSRIVTLDAPLPAFSADGSRAITASPLRESGPFFYTNDTVNRGDMGHNMTTTVNGRTIKSNDWGRGINIGGYPPSISPPYCRPRYDPAFNGAHWADLTAGQQAAWDPDSCRRRVEIVAISSDRLTLTLASPYFETISFPFSVVGHDGLYREMFTGGKGSFEMKTADRVLVEGNLIDSKIPTTLHPQSNDPPRPMTVTIVGDQVTLHQYTDIYSGITYYTWPGNFAEVVAQWRTFGGPDPLLRVGTPLPFVAVTRLTGDNNYNLAGRYVKSIDSPTTATLWPVDARFQGNDTVGDITSGTRWLYLQTNSHWTSSHQVWRYNVSVPLGPQMMGSNLMGGHSESSGQVMPPYHPSVIIHDNLLVPGHPSTYGYPDWAGSYWWEHWPIAVGDMGAALTRYAPITGQVALNNDNSNSYARVSHNAVVRMWPRISSESVFNIPGDTPIPAGGCHDFEFADNIADQWSTLFGGSYGAMTSAQNAPYFGAPFTIARNIMIRGDAPTQLPANVGTFAPDNVGLTDATKVGFTNYTAALPAMLDPANYVLQDIYTTGTVGIDSSGTVVTLESGAFPTTICAGQFFRTSTSTTLVPIASVPVPGLGASWASYTGYNTLVKTGGVAQWSGTGTGPRAYARATQVLANDQWAQVTVPSLAITADNCGIGLRYGAAPGTPTGYLLQFHENTGIQIYQQNGFESFVALGSPSGAVVRAGNVVLAEIQGSTITVSINGTPFMTVGGATAYSSGGVVLETGNAPGNTFDTFSCGGYSAPNVRAAASFSDAFTGAGTTQVTLATPYPEQGVSGKSYAITFKGTATDGTDPGPNIPVLKQFTDSVRALR